MLVDLASNPNLQQFGFFNSGLTIRRFPTVRLDANLGKLAVTSLPGMPADRLLAVERPKSLGAAEVARAQYQLTLSALSLRPGLYCRQGDAKTWENLSAAIASGAACAGIWVARWLFTNGKPIAPVDWSDAKVKVACPATVSRGDDSVCIEKHNYTVRADLEQQKSMYNHQPFRS